jgi:hypothetical protein
MGLFSSPVDRNVLFMVVPDKLKASVIKAFSSLLFKQKARTTLGLLGLCRCDQIKGERKNAFA